MFLLGGLLRCRARLNVCVSNSAGHADLAGCTLHADYSAVEKHFLTVRRSIGRNMLARWSAIAVLFVAVCSAEFAHAATPAARTFEVGGLCQWIDTGMDFAVGQCLTLTSHGSIVVSCRDRWKQGQELRVGPEGTFTVFDGLAAQHFPLPAGQHGPAPCFCLIGCIGNEAPFFVGRATSIRAPASGRLRLGINRFEAAQISGSLTVSVHRAADVEPLWIEQHFGAGPEDSPPPQACRVVVFYVDGLRPDVVREMVAMGHLPTIRELFVDGGAWLKNNFTGFPSDTITSNGTMWTGCFSDRHGLKGQVRFSREQLQSESYLEPLGPDRSSRLLAPQGIDRLLTDGEEEIREVIDGPEQARNWRKKYVTATPPLYQFLRSDKKDWATGVLPIMTEVPPALWTRSMTRELPWFESHNAWQYIDEANANFGVRHLLHRDAPVTVLWFPETDSVSHKCSRGQFGTTRRTIARADELIERVVNELRATGKFETTCFMLVSDHGHHGGRTTHLRHFDLANEFFFSPRLIDSHVGHSSVGQTVSFNGRLQQVGYGSEPSPSQFVTGGGLGVSVRMHRFWNRHPEVHQNSFVFIDADSSGVARIFMPRRSLSSRDWARANRPGDLLNYCVSDDAPAVDLIASLADARTTTGERTVDLVLARLNEFSMLISTADRGHAVIDRKSLGGHRWAYRYRPVRKIWTDGNGGVEFLVSETSKSDPLMLTQKLPQAVLREYHDEETWLRMLADWVYPDSVVTLARHMLWQDNLSEQEREFAPDLVATARPGWYFGLSSTPGTNHGYPLRDAMNASWFVSGPGIRRGAVIDAPSRLVDLTPTILDVIGHRHHESWFDGRPRRAIYAQTTDAQQSGVQAVSWESVDLAGWQPLDYQPVPDSEFKPRSINHPENRFDLSNTAYNVAAITDMSWYRLFDDVLSPLPVYPSGRPGLVTAKVDRLDEKMRHKDRAAVRDSVEALNVPEFAVSDYSATSLGNLQRANGAIDWLQARGQAIDRRIAAPVGKDATKPGTIVNSSVDATQTGFWEVYRFGQRLVIKTLDETIINGFENTVDRTVNSWRQTPSVRRAR